MSDIRFYGKLLLMRFPAMAFLFLLAACVGVIVAMRLPTMYGSSAKLLVESAQIPDELVRSSIQIDASEQLEVIQQRLMTRANLLDVARANNVFPNIRQMSPDEIVDAMRKRTSVKRTSGRNKATLMTLSFRGPNPQQVAGVVNQYVTIVLATNSDFRTARAQGTLDFFEQEVETLSESLALQSQKIVEFKSENADALPENLSYRQQRQSLLQERLARAERDLEALRSQRASIERAYQFSGTIQPQGRGPRAVVRISPQQQQLNALEAELRAALSIYSEQNPRVRILRSQIDGLKTQIEAQAPAVDGSATEEAEAEAEADAQVEQQLTALDVSLAELDARAETLQREIGDTQTELTTLQNSIERTPVVRITLDALEREQANIQTLYNGAVQRRNQARLGERVEQSNKGERITVLEPANVPNAPSSPNRAAIAGAGVGVGLGLAAAFFLLLELMNQAIRRPTDIVNALDVTPLATLPRLETAVHRRWRRAAQIATLGFIIVAVPAALWAVDTFYLPLDQLFERIRDRLL